MYKILLAGGGSGGSVSPLLAVATHIKKYDKNCEFLLVGTKFGPENKMSEYYNVPFESITTGKLRRYFSLRNLLLPFELFVGIIQSIKILKKFKPAVVVGAGSFVEVPVVIASYFMKIPVILHQQDVVISLSNKVCQFFAKKITVCFESSIRDFFENSGIFYDKKNVEKVVQIGNPSIEYNSTKTKSEIQKDFNLNETMPVLLVLGGGTGSSFLNRLVYENIDELTKTFQIIHLTGGRDKQIFNHSNYKQFDFLANIYDAYFLADMVVCRAGMSTITELSIMKKVSIIIPMPNSHQVFNAELIKTFLAGIVFEQPKIKVTNFPKVLKKLLFDRNAQKTLIHNISRLMPKNSTERLTKIIFEVIGKYEKKY